MTIAVRETVAATDLRKAKAAATHDTLYAANGRILAAATSRPRSTNTRKTWLGRGVTKAVAASALAAMLLTACGITAKPQAGTLRIDSALGNHAQVDDPRGRHAKCLRSDGFKIREYLTPGRHLFAIQVASLPAGPTIVFEASSGIAQGLQIVGRAQSAYVIGAALVYPNLASDRELTKLENCVAIGVTG